jgi:hypothetical protein
MRKDVLFRKNTSVRGTRRFLMMKDCLPHRGKIDPSHCL